MPIRQVDSTRDGGGQDKALAVERKAKGAVRARKVDERDAGKAQYTAEHLGRIELFGAKRQGGKEDCEEVGAGLDDGARHGAGAREAQIEKEVLPDSLEERQDKDGLDVASLRNEGAALGRTHPNDNQAPASVKRKPAKSSCEALSCAGIPKSA